MKRRILTIIVVLCLSLMITQSSLAFAMGNVEGVWGTIDTNGATCDGWATGNGDTTPYRSGTDPDVQNDVLSDENEVRYGIPQGQGQCDNTPNQNYFAAQSGMGWDGNNSVNDGLPLGEGQPFWLARYTHYNNPISASNSFQYADVNVTIFGIRCNNGLAPTDHPDGTQTFVFRLALEETPNDGTCEYGGSGQNCNDRITFNVSPAYATFACSNDSVPGVYTVSIAGFQPHTSTNCATQTYNPALVSNAFITAEQTDNHACMWAAISRWSPTAVELTSFAVEPAPTGALVTWETAQEIDNIGFNLYRADDPTGEKIKLNGEIIPSNVPPGSPFGADYEYLDETVPDPSAAYYWLEDVDLYGQTTLHGPVFIVHNPVIFNWRLFLPEILSLP